MNLERFQITLPVYISLRSMAWIAVGHQVTFCLLALGRGGEMFSELSVFVIFFNDCPLAAISNMRRITPAWLSLTSNFTPPSIRTLR
jgi:hypothetical protein